MLRVCVVIPLASPPCTFVEHQIHTRHCTAVVPKGFGSMVLFENLRKVVYSFPQKIHIKQHDMYSFRSFSGDPERLCEEGGVPVD